MPACLTAVDMVIPGGMSAVQAGFTLQCHCNVLQESAGRHAAPRRTSPDRHVGADLPSTPANP